MSGEIEKTIEALKKLPDNELIIGEWAIKHMAIIIAGLLALQATVTSEKGWTNYVRGLFKTMIGAP